MLIGAGGLGGITLELLARQPSIGRILVGGRDRRRGEARCNLAKIGAIAQGFNPTIDFAEIDLHNLDQTAEAIHRHAPDLILSTATLQTWWLPDLLPAPQAAAIHRAGFGVWLPVHLTLTLKFMQAVRQADYKGITLTAPFPDAINNILLKLGLAPTCGIGNIDEVVPAVRAAAAMWLNVPLESIRVAMVGHHALQSAVTSEPVGELPPYFLRVWHGWHDVTDELDADHLLRNLPPMTGGQDTHFLTASTTIHLINALLSDAGDLLHAPAPNGLPGGYPVIASRAGVQVASIDGLTLEQAIAINEASHRFDGIDHIEPDGTAVFVPEAAQVIYEALGYDCKQLHPMDAEARAGELMTRFREYAARHGVDLTSVRH
jgi:hypothetical protein